MIVLLYYYKLINIPTTILYYYAVLHGVWMNVNQSVKRLGGREAYNREINYFFPFTFKCFHIIVYYEVLYIEISILSDERVRTVNQYWPRQNGIPYPPL